MIYIIAKIWQGGKLECIQAYRKESDARKIAGDHISIKGEFYHVIILSCKLED